jgi:hypothetical protein
MKLMKSKCVTTIAGLLLVMSAFTQVKPLDSTALAKNEKQNNSVLLRLNERKDKLAKMEEKLLATQNQEAKAANDAVASSDDNRRAAVRLSDDPSDKKKARQAEQRSDGAKRDAKKARKASSELQSLESDIKSLKKKIESDEKELTVLEQKRSGN